MIDFTVTCYPNRDKYLSDREEDMTEKEIENLFFGDFFDVMHISNLRPTHYFSTNEINKDGFIFRTVLINEYMEVIKFMKELSDKLPNYRFDIILTSNDFVELWAIFRLYKSKDDYIQKIVLHWSEYCKDIERPEYVEIFHND